MAPTSIFFNGRLITTPGAYTEVDASGLEVVGLTASGIVAAIGEAKGGTPWNAIDPSEVRAGLQIATSPQQPMGWFREGDLREVAPMIFGPSDDPDIPAGAQEIVFVKTNPAVQSSATFGNVDGDAMDVESLDYGHHTTQINMEIGTGTTKGKLITVVFEAIEETFDDVGGDSIFKIIYLASTPALGFTTVTLAVTASQLISAFTRTQLGLDTDVTNPAAAGEVIELVSSDAGDTAVIIEIIGTNALNAGQRELVTLNGLTAVDTTGLWNSFHGARVYSGTLAGTCTIRRNGAGLTICTLTAGDPIDGMAQTVDHPVAGEAVTVVADGASVARLTIVGLSVAGAVQVETLQLAGAVPVPGTATWSRIDYLAVGEVAAARTVTLSGNAVKTPYTGYTTLQKVADKFNGTPGYTLTIETGATTFVMSNLDIAAATNCKSPANPQFYANLYACIDILNTSSQLVSASRATPGTGAPSNTTAAVYLTGGHEGSSTPGLEATPTSTFSDWQGAIDLLTKIRVNTIWVASADPAVHAAVKAHCAYMAGIGRSERDCKVGLMNAAMTGLATKTEIKAQIVNLNTRHVQAWAQTVERYNTAGEAEVFDAPFGAAILAGMQAGTNPGVPLTHRTMNTLSIKQDSTWNPVDDTEEMIKAGLCFAEVMDGVGRRVVRNVTTHLSSTNLAFQEASVNEAVNYSVFNYRTQMELAVGQPGYAGSVSAARGDAINILGLLIGVSLVAWRSLTFKLVLDVLENSLEISPVLPINFVKTTVHLVSIPQSAST